MITATFKCPFRLIIKYKVFNSIYCRNSTIANRIISNRIVGSSGISTSSKNSCVIQQQIKEIRDGGLFFCNAAPLPATNHIVFHNPLCLPPPAQAPTNEELPPENELTFLKEQDLMKSPNLAFKKEYPQKTKMSTFLPQKLKLSPKVQLEDLRVLGKKDRVTSRLRAYVDICILNNEGLKVEPILSHFLRRKNTGNINDPKVFSPFLHFAAKKKWYLLIQNMLLDMEGSGLKPDAQCFAALLECYGRLDVPERKIKEAFGKMQNLGIPLEDLLTKCHYLDDELEYVLKALSIANVTLQELPIPSQRYFHPLLKDFHLLPKAKEFTTFSLSRENLTQLYHKQMEMEKAYFIPIKSVISESDVPPKLKIMRKRAHDWEEKCRADLYHHLKNALSRNTPNYVKGYLQMDLKMYLKTLPPKILVELMMKEIQELGMSSEVFSFPRNYVYLRLGTKVMQMIHSLAKERAHIPQKIELLYSKYLDYICDPAKFVETFPRHFWEKQKWQNLLGPSVEYKPAEFSPELLVLIGTTLYRIINNAVRIDSSLFSANPSKAPHKERIFYTVTDVQGVKKTYLIKPSPLLIKLYQSLSKDTLYFEANLLPMVCPPLPWTTSKFGGFLHLPTDFLRHEENSRKQSNLLKEMNPEEFGPVLDALNSLSECAWRINPKMLDLVIDLFKKGGNTELEVPIPVSAVPDPPTILPNMTKEEKKKLNRERKILQAKKQDTYSLWCDFLYLISIANHFRNDILWFPHNIDFRGRVYPVPPHLNHIRGDACRGLLQFAKGKPLGPDGLRWLKLHLVNLSGMLKKATIEDRLKWIENLMPEILDSADNPMDGRKWWMKCEDRWQALACCMEIANAVRSPDPAAYVCHFPVHQDGSCNGLQHYAALGRDKEGAAMVNLAPGNIPGDVYARVSQRVEEQRKHDAAIGLEIAKKLENHIKRKVVKQPVMTVVYGVTPYGATHQVKRKLKEVPELSDCLGEASSYVAQNTLTSLADLFKAPSQIQAWLTSCAIIISKICGEPVEWVTPLGLPVIQPYYSRVSRKPSQASYGDTPNMKFSDNYCQYEKPDAVKQKNAFPANFVHSLDSVHMMLSSLHCRRSGINFVSVHDCYWTHPCDVAAMNRICREQFVALHSLPILEDLSQYFLSKYSYEILPSDPKEVVAQKEKVNSILRNVPMKGDFDLNKVLESVFFFS